MEHFPESSLKSPFLNIFKYFKDFILASVSDYFIENSAQYKTNNVLYIFITKMWVNKHSKWTEVSSRCSNHGFVLIIYVNTFCKLVTDEN